MNQAIGTISVLEGIMNSVEIITFYNGELLHKNASV